MLNLWAKSLRTSVPMLSMSALRGEADIADPRSNVRQSPKADIARSWLDLGGPLFPRPSY